MANNRELSQLGSFVNIDDTSRNIGIATTATPYVGIGTTNPQYKLDVHGDINFTQDLYKNGQLFTSGVGVGSDNENANGVIGYRVGVGFTDINFVGTGLSVIGYGSTVVVDFSEISAASASALSISTIIQDIAFVGGATTTIIGISSQTDRFVYDTQTGSLGVGSATPAYKLDVSGDINFTDNLYKDGQLFTSGIGVGIATVNPQSGIITGRVGVGFTDINFIGAGITVTGYGSTVVVDMTSISAATAGTGGASDDVIRLAIAFG